jgi:hypothetical protein
VSHRVVATVAELRGVLATPGPHVVIVRTDRTENVLEHERLNRAISDAVRADTPTGG